MVSPSRNTSSILSMRRTSFRAVLWQVSRCTQHRHCSYMCINWHDSPQSKSLPYHLMTLIMPPPLICNCFTVHTFHPFTYGSNVNCCGRGLSSISAVKRTKPSKAVSITTHIAQVWYILYIRTNALLLLMTLLPAYTQNIIQRNLSKTATCGPVPTDHYREVAALQR